MVPPRFQAASWKALECAGSDHVPLQTDLPLGRDPVKTAGRCRVRWSWKRADWRKFEATAEARLAAEPPPQGANAHALGAHLKRVVLDAAGAAIPRKAPGQHGEQCRRRWWTPELEGLVRERQ